MASIWKNKGSSVADSFYTVRPECADDVPKTRFKIKVGQTLSPRRWGGAFTQEGFLDITKILGRIQRGGIHPSIRGEVWEFLLGCFDPNSSFEERDQLKQHRRMQYARLKEECREMYHIVGSGRIITAPIITEDGQPIQDPLVIFEAHPAKALSSTLQTNESSRNSELSIGNRSQENASDHLSSNTGDGLRKVDFASHAPLDKKEIQWKLTLHQIGLDVIRTDRTLVFYEKQEHLSKLWDILAVYAWVDKDVGYCQGMSDLCSPMVVLFKDEADAYWCFERLMRRLDLKRGNFRCTERSIGVENQLHSLASITQVLDPKLHRHLETLGGGDYLFAIRMLMVLFRREFSFGDSLYLWEMMWALEYDPDIFSMYEERDLISLKRRESKGKVKSARQCGKFERENLKNGKKITESLPISVFLVASVLESKSSKLLQEARGLDDVVKILNGITGNLDAKKACSGAIKLHKKYLKKAKKM